MVLGLMLQLPQDGGGNYWRDLDLGLELDIYLKLSVTLDIYYGKEVIFISGENHHYLIIVGYKGHGLL